MIARDKEITLIAMGNEGAETLLEMPREDSIRYIVASREVARLRGVAGVEVTSLNSRDVWNDLGVNQGVFVVLASLGDSQGGKDLEDLARELASEEVVFLLTLPNKLEGDLKGRQAQKTLQHLQKSGVAVLCFDEELTFPKRASSLESAYRQLRSSIASTVSVFMDMLRSSGIVSISVQDLKALLDGGWAIISAGVGQAYGSRATEQAIENLLEHELLGGASRLAETEIALLYMKLGSVFGDLSYLQDLGDKIAQYCTPSCAFLKAYGESPNRPDHVEIMLISLKLMAQKYETQVGMVIESAEDRYWRDPELVSLYLQQENLPQVLSYLEAPSYKRMKIKI